MPNIPCPTKVVCPDCFDSPLMNLSAEAPDEPAFVGVAFPPYNPPIGWYGALGCLHWVFTTESQARADFLAAAQAPLCDDGDGGGGGKPDGIGGDDGGKPFPDLYVYYNNEVSCSLPCPDGSTFTVTVAAGEVYSRISQADADAIARAVCWQRVNLLRFCFADPNLPAGCLGSSYEHLLTTTGGTAPITFTVDPAQLPGGFTLLPNGYLSGLPTATGTFPMTVTATDSSTPPRQISKAFTLVFSSILTSAVLPDGVVGSAYNTALSADNAPAGAYWELVSGSLPSGVTLNTVTGIISGIPLETGYFQFEIELKEP